MPTTISLASRHLNTGPARASATNPTLDLVVVVCFALIGVLLATGFTLFPPSTDVVALMASVS